MGQFDVYSNPGRARGKTPFVVSLQSDRLATVSTRLVAALVVAASVRPDNPNLKPTFIVVGQEVILDPFNLATVLASHLGKPVASLADEESRAKLVRAMDELLSQA